MAIQRVSKTPTRRSGPSRGRTNPGYPGGYGGYSTNQDHHITHSWPWLVLALGLVLGIVLHAFTTTTTAMVGMVALLIAATGVVAYSAWMTTRQRSGVARWHSVATVLFGGGWLALCTVTGAITATTTGDVTHYNLVGVTDALWLVGGGAAALAWNHRIGNRIGLAKEAMISGAWATNDDPDLNSWEEATNTQGIRVRGERINEYFTEGTLRLSGRGNTLEGVRRVARQIEINEGWPYESLTIAPHPTSNNSQFLTYRVQHADPLAKPVRWPGLKIGPKTTLLDPMPKGMGADGNPYGLHIAKPGTGGLHRLVVGMSGSGKTVSEAPDLIWAAALGADLIVIDTAKQTQSYGELAPVMQLFVIDPGMARAVIERLMSHTLPERTRQLARERRKVWTPGSELHFLKLHIEEAWQIADASEIVDIALAFRSAGGQLTYSIQRPTFDQMPVTLRAQLATVVHFGIKEKDDEQYALPDEVRDAGGHPAKWGNDQPGMHFAVEGGMTLDQKAMARRSWQDPGEVNPTDPNSFANTATRVGRTLHTMDPITAGSLGELWTNRITPVDLVAQVEGRPTITPGPATRTAPVVAPEPAKEPTMPAVTALPSNTIDGEAVEAFLPTYSDDGQHLVFNGEDGLPPETIDLGETVTDPHQIADPYANLPEPPAALRTMRIGVPTNPNAVTKEEYTAAMEARLEELLAEPDRQLIVAADFISTWKSCGYSRPSAYDFLKDWTKAGRIAKLSSGKGWVPVRNRT